MTKPVIYTGVDKNHRFEIRLTSITLNFLRTFYENYNMARFNCYCV